MNEMQLPKDDGYDIKQADLLESIILMSISTQLTVAEILRRQISLERKIDGNPFDEIEVSNELRSISDQIAKAATERKNDLLIKMFLRNK